MSHPSNLVDLTGQKLDRWTVLERILGQHERTSYPGSGVGADPRVRDGYAMAPPSSTKAPTVKLEAGNAIQRTVLAISSRLPADGRKWAGPGHC
jgi:hypothetical protein